MLFSAKANQLAGGGEQGRLAQATEIPSLFHRGSLMWGEFQSMQELQRIVNSLSGARYELFIVCNMLHLSGSIRESCRSYAVVRFPQRVSSKDTLPP